MSEDRETYRRRLVAALQATVEEVMGTMAWSTVELSSTEERPILVMTDEVAGLIRLMGGQGGMVGFSCSRALGITLVSRITGLGSAEILEEDLLDGISELANMLGGGMKSKAMLSNLDISPPVAIIGTQYKAQWKTDHTTLVLSFQLEGEMFHVHACV